MPFKRIILHILFLCATTALFAQQQVIDSMNIEISNSLNDTLRAARLLQRANMDKDYGRNDSAIAAITRARDISLKRNYRTGLLYSYIREGEVYMAEDLYQQAIDCETQAISLAKKYRRNYIAVQAATELAGVFLCQGDYGSAMKLYSKALDMPSDENYDVARQRIELGMMNATLSQGDYYEAMVHAKAALKINERVGSVDSYVMAMSSLAMASLSLRDTMNARLYIKAASDSIKNTHFNAVISEYAEDISKYNCHSKDSAAALKPAHQWLNRNLRNHYKQEYASNLLRFSLTYQYYKDTAHAISYAVMAQKEAQEINSRRTEARAYSILGDLARDSAGKMQNYVHALGIQRKYRIKADELMTYVKIGEYLLRSTKNPILAHYYSIRACDTLINAYNIAVETDNKYYLALIAKTIGSSANVNLRPVQAMNYYNKALKIEKEFSYMSRGLASTYDGIGYAYILQRDSLRALQFLYKARKMEEDSGYKKDLVQTLTHYALVYELDRNFDKALLYFSKASALATEIHDTASLPLPDLCSGIIYEEQKWDTLKAYDYYYKAARESKNCHDIVHNSESLFRLAELLFHAHKYEEAEIFYNQCLNYAIASENDFIQMRCYHGLYVIYQAHNLAKESSDAYDKYRELVFKLKKEKQ